MVIVLISAETRKHNSFTTQSNHLVLSFSDARSTDIL